MTISAEKEVILILAETGKRSAIMRAVLQEAGPSTEAGAIVFSMPVTGVAGVDVVENSEI